MRREDSSDDGMTGRVRILTTIEEIDRVAGLWRSLWSRCEGLRTPFLSYEFVCVWVRHYGQGRHLHILLVEDDETVIGIMPLVWMTYRIGPLTREALETIGSESRNLVALIAPGAESTAARLIADHLKRSVLRESRCLRLSLVPSTQVFPSELGKALRSSSADIAVASKPVSFAPYAPLPAQWRDFERRLGRRRREALARAQRRLDLARKHVHVRSVGGDEIEAAMADLFHLHQQRWKGVRIRGLFEDEDSRAFHLDFARAFSRLGWLDISMMEIDGKVGSVSLIVLLDGVVYLLRSGRNTSFAEYSIGHLHDLSLFRKWIHNRLVEVDFLRGAEPYKFYWTRNYRTYVEIIAVKARWTAPLSLFYTRTWLAFARFLSHRHPPREIIAYLRTKHFNNRELRRMGIRLQP